MNAAFTVYKEFPKLRLQGEYIPLLLQLRFYRKQKK